MSMYKKLLPIAIVTTFTSLAPSLATAGPDQFLEDRADSPSSSSAANRAIQSREVNHQPRYGVEGLPEPYIHDDLADREHLGFPSFNDHKRIIISANFIKKQIDILGAVSEDQDFTMNREASYDAVQFRFGPHIGFGPDRKHFISRHPPLLSPYTQHFAARKNQGIIRDAQEQRELYETCHGQITGYLNVHKALHNKLMESRREGVTAHNVKPTHVIYHRLPNLDDLNDLPEFRIIPLEGQPMIGSNQGFSNQLDSMSDNCNEHLVLANGQLLDETRDEFHLMLDNCDTHLVPANGRLLDQNFAENGLSVPLYLDLGH